MLSSKIYHYLKNCKAGQLETKLSFIEVPGVSWYENNYNIVRIRVEVNYPGPNSCYFLSFIQVLQQSNGYDCGVHLLANAEHSLRHIMIYGNTSGLSALSENDAKGRYHSLQNISHTI